MSEASSIRQAELELHELAQAYAAKAEALATDPYFREAVVKVSVSSFAWAFYDAFSGDTRNREVLRDELVEQAQAVGRALVNEK